MRTLFADASRAFVREWLASILILLPGVLAAPNLNQAVALGIAALIASIAAGAKTLQAFVPLLTFAKILPQPYAAWADAFTRGFLAAFLVSVYGISSMPDLSGWRSVAVGILVGAVSAGARALEATITPGQSAIPSRVRRR
jgi:hypothetical protein